MAQLAHRHGRLAAPDISAPAAAARCAADKTCRPTSASGGWRLKNFTSATEWFSPPGSVEPVRERKFLVAVFQVRRERGDLAVELQRLCRRIRGACVWPQRASHCSNSASDNTSVSAPSRRWRCVSASHWMNSQSAGGNNSCSCVARTTRSIDVAQRARLLAGARARAGEIARPGGGATAPPRPAAAGRRRAAWRAACRAAAARAARASFPVPGRACCSCSASSAWAKRSRLACGCSSGGTERLARRNRNASSSSRALPCGVQQPRPPVRVGKILAREREFFEIILQQQPRALRIGAGRETAQDVLALVDGRLRVGQFAAQIGERAVGLRQHLVVRVVFRRARRPRAVPVSD